MKSLLITLFTFAALLSPPLLADSQTRVLVMGDSQSVGPFGKELHRLLSAQYATELRASCGSSLFWWNSGHATNCGSLQITKAGHQSEVLKRSTPILTQLLTAIKPDWVILEFGGNYRFRFTPDPKLSTEANAQARVRKRIAHYKWVISDIRQALDQIETAGARCFFATGPDTRKFRDLIPELAEKLQEAVGNRCTFFNSFAVTQYPEKGGDGLHYTDTEEHRLRARNWALMVFNEFSKGLAR